MSYMNYRKIDEANTPEEMRAAIYKLTRDEPTVRSVCDAANYHGWSAEDKYTMLAYYALQHMQAYRERVLAFSALDTRQTLVIQKEAPRA